MSKLCRTLYCILALSIILFSGCTSDNTEKTIENNSKSEVVSDSSAQEEPASEEEPSVIFIAFEGTDLEGNMISQEIFSQSKLTMVNVWATYCNPCLREMPGLGELAAEHDTEEFQIIGVVSDVWEGESQDLVESLVQQTGANYPHLLVNDSVNNALLADVTGVPTTFFFDEEGAYLGGVVGSAEKSTWEELVNELLEKI